MTPQEQQARKFRKTAALDFLYRSRRPAVNVDGRLELHDWAASYIGQDQKLCYLEFGVFAGQTIRQWAKGLRNPDSRLVGFDSFLGLPEVWDVGFKTFPQGTFSTGGQPPKVNDLRLSFVTGWFQNTVPEFLQTTSVTQDRINMVHFDADLYSSTLFLLTTLWHYLPEYYFIMDDFSQDDSVALHDFAIAYPVKIEWIAERLGAADTPYHVFGKLTRVPLVLEGATEASSLPSEPEPSPMVSVANIDRVEAPEAQSLLMRFESVGADCEFGLVQRRFGAEPLGLLRWGNISPVVLINLLRSEFGEFAEPTNFQLVRSAWGEYIMRDLKFGINFHTWLKDCGEDEDKFFTKQWRRINRLREKILDDLKVGEKTFVYRTPGNASDLEAQGIAAAFRTYGRTKLLYVSHSDDKNDCGSVTECGPGFVRGYLSRFGADPVAKTWNIAFDEWLAICEQTGKILAERH